MATAEVIENNPRVTSNGTPPHKPGEQSPLLLLWKCLASLKLTVVLLVLLMMLVMAGTLAQKENDIWKVVNEGYFRVWFAKIELQIIPTLLGVFKPNKLDWTGHFLFPGGYLIGGAMAINLLAAHTLRYKVRARGTRLAAALLVLALGTLATWLVISRALDSAYEASLTSEFSANLWNLCRGAYAGLVLGAAYLLSLAWGKIRKPEWFTLAALNVAMLAAAIYLFVNPEMRIPDAGMRIVWQGLQASVAGSLLLAALALLFDKRSGVILLHIGIAMLMAHEFYVAETNVEAKMIIPEGGSANWVYDDRETELAIIDRSSEETDHVTVIPGELIAKAAEASADSEDRVIRSDELPVDVKVVEYFPNMTIAPQAPPTGESPLRGAARTIEAKSAEVNPQQVFPGAYIELLDKKSQESLGQYLVTLFFDKEPTMLFGPMFQSWAGYPTGSGEQVVEGSDTPLAISMRYKRIYKPYDIALRDFSFDKFAGSSKAKNYSADVTLTDHETGSVIDFHIFMNNPLRYRGETFYQTGFDQWTEKTTILQVVENEGWMVPYIACAAVGVGMLVHFGIILLRFLNRRLRELNQTTPEPTETFSGQWLRSEIVVPVIVGTLTLAIYVGLARPKEPEANGISLQSVATLPVLDEARVKPFDTVARNMLQWFCQRQEASVSLENKRDRISATQWLLDVATGKEVADKYYVFRIVNPELLSTLGLDARPGFYRYSASEIRQNLDKLIAQAREADQVDPQFRSLYQNDIMELMDKLLAYRKVQNAYSVPMTQSMESDRETFKSLQQGPKVRAVVPTSVDGEWQTVFEGTLDYLMSAAEQRQTNVPARPLAAAMIEWYQDRPEKFLEAIDQYHLYAKAYEAELNAPENSLQVSKMKTVEKLDSDRIAFEAWFNGVAPFFYAAIMYLVAMILSASSWLVLPKTLGRSAIAIVAVTLVFHTLAIAARVYISDRPPITNLYTTAICIGWVMVLLMLVFESIFKLGFGSFVASAVGFTTLLIAHYLGLDEDTFTVMQAVLDTQFWLTTHVLSINIGYATTMLAGCFGIVYVIGVQVLNMFSEKERRQIYGMMYGSLCFAILFSFIGTVLGGLWADDSWGRFWGWDPKENGALLIVLWNAVALHARWDRMIGPRGLALLTILGNIVTAWSWFGVNQLSVGLHAYAFRPDLAFYLWWFIVSQMVLFVIGLIPWHFSGPAPRVK
ncbi:cytochrome c biogenesis protein [Aeoliella mucimassa]|uniref:Cytochrome c biogenesis protein CcsA n=1 Tax=Aeoliella mucimassa TaxID=2527972 RepID=A0A518ANW8_9BACT|nr:cytochrome c biogenesis protein CcsA [Aeoliella mucimassa]QDU56419.1 Cytochrome c biogenesis protein CcsA [Aeoliella mucimassa]